MFAYGCMFLGSKLCIVTWCITGCFWRRFGRARWCPFYRLCVETQLQLFRIRQELLLQVVYAALWYLHGPGMGMWVRCSRSLSRLGDNSIPKRAYNLLWILSEIRCHLYQLLHDPVLWCLWKLHRSHQDWINIGIV